MNVPTKASAGLGQRSRRSHGPRAHGAQDAADATTEGQSHDMPSPGQHPGDEEDRHGRNPAQHRGSQDLRFDPGGPPST